MPFSVIRQCTADLLSALDGINGAPTYNRTVSKVYRAARAPKEVGRDPADYINLLGISWRKVQEFAHHVDAEATVTLGIYARIGLGGDEPYGEVLDLGADVDKAAMIDQTRGGIAQFTRIGETGEIAAVHTKADYAEGQLPIVFRFRYNKFDPTVKA